MSDPVTSHDIEDVLSSIRRLVAQGDPHRSASRPATPQKPEVAIDVRRTEKAKPQAPVESQPDRLILTPALRVPAAEAKIVRQPSVAPSVAPGYPEPIAAKMPSDAGAPPAPQKTSNDRASLEATIAELEAAVREVPDDFEPDGTEIAESRNAMTSPLRDRAEAAQVTPAENTAGGTETSLNDAVMDHIAHTVADEIAGVFPNLNAVDTVTSKDPNVVPLTPERRAAKSASHASEDSAKTVTSRVHKPVNFRIQRNKNDVPQEPAANAPAAAASAPAPVEPVEKPDLPLEDLVTPVVSESPAFRSLRDVYDPAAEAAAEAVENAPDAGDIYGDELAPDVDEPGTAVAEAPTPTALADPDMLRDMVSQMIREELQGEMGERITRNVRKLVRREINRVLSEQDFR